MGRWEGGRRLANFKGPPGLRRGERSLICSHLFSLSRRWKSDPYLRLPRARRAPPGPPLPSPGAWPTPGQARGGGGRTLHAGRAARCPCGRAHQPGVLSWPLLTYLLPGAKTWGLVGGGGALTATTAVGSQPFPAICRILFSPTLNLFSSAAQPVSYFLPHSEARAPQTLPSDFPGDEIRSKRGSLH